MRIEIEPGRHGAYAPVPKRPHRCFWCGRTYSTWERLFDHKLNGHPERPPAASQPYSRSGSVACGVCPASYATEADARMHREAHHRLFWGA